MGMVGLQELAIIVLIALVIFGPRQLPKLGRAAGETLRELRGFRAAVEKVDKDADG